MKKNINIILATNSPRRIELFKQIYPAFEVYKQTYIEEDDYYNINPEKIVLLNASNKAKNALNNINYNQCIIISADTIVAIDKTILGKPENKDKAISFLKKLSGKSHSVYTGVSIINKRESNIKEINFVEKTTVAFNFLAEEEIEEYVRIFNPIDKAGAYGIQEVPSSFIKSINGDYDNIVGLPIKRLKEILDKITI